MVSLRYSQYRNAHQPAFAPWDSTTTLQARVVEHYRQPFEAVLQSPDAHSQLGQFDLELSLCQLVGPLVFAW